MFVEVNGEGDVQRVQSMLDSHEDSVVLNQSEWGVAIREADKQTPETLVRPTNFHVCVLGALAAGTFARASSGMWLWCGRGLWVWSGGICLRGQRHAVTDL